MLILAAKRPEESLAYRIDWSARLGGDTIVGSPSVTVTGAVKSAQSNDTSSVTFTLSGGTAGTVAKIEASAVTASGQTLSDIAVMEIGGEAVSLAEVKAYLRIETDDEDVVIAGLLRSALGHVETATCKKLTPKIFEQQLAGFPGSHSAVRLWYGPVSEVLAVAYDDGAGIEQSLGDFRLVEGTLALLLPGYGASWPATAAGPGTVRVTYVAGYGATDREIAELGQAVMMLVAHWYQNREAGSAANVTEIPLGVQALIGPYRPVGLG